MSYHDRCMEKELDADYLKQGVLLAFERGLNHGLRGRLSLHEYPEHSAEDRLLRSAYVSGYDHGTRIYHEQDEIEADMFR